MQPLRERCKNQTKRDAVFMVFHKYRFFRLLFEIKLQKLEMENEVK